MISAIGERARLGAMITIRRPVMLYPIVVLAALLVTALAGQLRAETALPIPESETPQLLGMELRPPPDKVRPIEVRATGSSLGELARWLSENYELPYAAEPPRLEKVTPLRLYQLRHRAFLASQTIGRNTKPQPGYQREVVAVYDDKERTVYLPESWTGDTIAEQSILVHEMVHHLQNLAGMKFACAGEREKPAYLAQDKFLRQHGLDLEKEFDVDMFTVVAISICMN
jgi:hypothetical protein